MNKLLKIAITCAAITPIHSYATEAPKVTLGGRLDTQAFAVDSKKPYQYINPASPSSEGIASHYGFVQDTKLDIKVEGKINNSYTYGTFIRLNADTSQSVTKETTLGNKTMVYFQSDKFGRLEAGNTPGAGALLEMDTVNIYHGSFGVNGYTAAVIGDRTVRVSSIYNTVNGILAAFSQPALKQINSRPFEFIITPNLPTNYSGQYYSDAPKVNFFTKPFEWLTAGISFIPNLDSSGTVANRAPINGGPRDSARSNLPATFKHIVSGGFIIDKKITNDFGIRSGLSGEYGKAKLNYAHDLKALEAGLMFTYKTVQIGGSYGNWFDSLTLKNGYGGGKHKADYFMLAAGQNLKPFGYSVTYLNSRKAGGVELAGKKLVDGLAAAFGSSPIPLSSFTDKASNKFQHVVLDVEYKAAEGLTPYLAVSHYRFNGSTGEKDRGYVGLLGTRLVF
jgi:hypothetical protein